LTERKDCHNNKKTTATTMKTAAATTTTSIGIQYNITKKDFLKPTHGQEYLNLRQSY